MMLIGQVVHALDVSPLAILFFLVRISCHGLLNIMGPFLDVVLKLNAVGLRMLLLKLVDYTI